MTEYTRHQYYRDVKHEEPAPLSPAGVQAVREWITALRSGIPQGSGEMRGNDQRCCLAVLCETPTVTPMVEVATARYEDDPDDGRVHYSYDGEVAVLPPHIALLIGSVGQDPILRFWSDAQFGGDNGIRTATSLNDAEHLSFESIADAVEHWYSEDLNGKLVVT